MIAKDSAGIRLNPALMATSSGAYEKSFDINFAVSMPPRFLLHKVSRSINFQKKIIHK